MKKMPFLFFWVLFVQVSFCFTCFAQSNPSSQTHIEGTLAINSGEEIVYELPANKHIALWSYLTLQYGEQQIPKLGTHLSSDISEEKVQDFYFDNPENTLLNNYASIRLRTYLVNDKVSKQQVVLNLSDSDNLAIRHNFDIDNLSGTNKSTLNSLLSRSEIKKINLALQPLAVRASNLNISLEVNQNRQQLTLRYKNQDFLSIAINEYLNQANARHLYEVSLKKYPALLNQLPQAEKTRLSEITNLVEENLVKAFPELRASQLPSYNKMYVVISHQPETDKTSAFAWLGLCILFISVISIIIRQHRKRRTYHHATYTNSI